MRHPIGVALKALTLKVLMGGHHLIELDGADEGKLTSKANAFAGACYGKVEIYTTNHRYQMRKSKIVDPTRYGWRVGDDGTTP